jgi:hypothetical protein
MAEKEEMRSGDGGPARDENGLRLTSGVVLVGDVDAEAAPLQLSLQIIGDAPDSGCISAFRRDGAKPNKGRLGVGNDAFECFCVE